MRKVGLTGGIGSGKSAVSRLLAARGAVVVDADVVAREVVEPGSPGLQRLEQEFGPQVLQPDGSLDRQGLGRVVFADPQALARLNAITHPLIAVRTRELFTAAEAGGTAVLVHDVALLVESGLAAAYDEVVVVAATPMTQLDRLVRLRGMPEADARARINSQAVLADRLAVATHVIGNDGPIRELVAQVDALWATWLAAPSADSEPDRVPAPGAAAKLSEPRRTVNG